MNIHLVVGFFFLLSAIVTNKETTKDGSAQDRTSEPILHFDFENTVNSTTGSSFITNGKNVSFVNSFDGKALRVSPDNSKERIVLHDVNIGLDTVENFTVLFWIKSGMDNNKASVILSNKDFNTRSLAAQKESGWVFYISEGVWAWNMGAGNRRLTHEYELDAEGKRLLNDNRWHQLAMSYSREKAEIRLFYDGDQVAIFNVADTKGFDFSSSRSLMIGSNGSDAHSISEIKGKIADGRRKLQKLVDEFHRLGLGKLTLAEFESLIVDPKGLYKTLSDKEDKQEETDLSKILEPVMKIRAELMDNPYTVHQVRDFMRIAPLLKIYALDDGQVIVNEDIVDGIIAKESLFPSEFDMDNLLVWNSVLSPQEIADSYAAYFEPAIQPLKHELANIKVGNWNIHHGGKHNTIEKDNWDSRVRIVEMLKKENVDLVMLQETYSSGVFIADQLGFYYASTIDRDYLNQGTNISVLSRYPIKEVYVPETATFMNVGVKIAISKTQDMYVMSNWYGMAQFPAVFDFHEARFLASDSIPIVFAGDFNAIPHTDRGESLAAESMLAAGFTDAYRSLYPDVDRYPGYTHHNNVRIDQLYYKGESLRNSSTKIISEWPTGFPSDHYLIVSEFKLNK